VKAGTEWLLGEDVDPLVDQFCGRRRRGKDRHLRDVRTRRTGPGVPPSRHRPEIATSRVAGPSLVTCRSFSCRL
jgi:hypothetical protein